MFGARPVIWAFHWYSETPLTRMNVRVAVTTFVSQVPPARPYLTVALVDEMSVAQLTITDVPTRSVRYG